ncbi:MAG: AMP-binding protein [Burkholderiaceae bacterium]
MCPAFSILAAARAAPRRIGLRIDGREFCFDELAALTRERIHSIEWPAAHRPYPLTGANTLATVITLYALLERGVAALMLHPKLTELERATLLAQADAITEPLPTDAAAVLFTSGTTGRPKAAVITQANLLASARTSRANIGWQDDDCWQMCMPIARVGGLSILTRCLAARRAVAIPPAFDAATWPQTLADQKVTLTSLVPTMLAKVLEHHPDWRAPGTLRALLLGGTSASHRLLSAAHAAGAPVIATYGMTEACSHVVATPYGERYRATIGSGRVLAGVALRIDHGRILVRGAMLMHGYWGQAPLDPAAWFDTGDLGELDPHDHLHVNARRSDLIVTGGDNVYPVEVEHALETVPGIGSATVLGLPDETWGQIVVALLVADGAPPPIDDLIAAIAARLSPHKRPRRIAFVTQLPQTAAGKPDRRPVVARALDLMAIRYPRA